MKKKYGGNFAGKELELFHGTSGENIKNINANGLNRSCARQNGKLIYPEISCAEYSNQMASPLNQVQCASI